VKWNPEVLKRLIDEHTVSGYHVETPLFKGTIDRQIRPERGGFIFYRVIADKPVPFGKLAASMHVSQKPKSLKEWTGSGSRTFPAMAWDLREKIEKGEKVSPADVLFRELADRGCMDLDQNVFCYTFPSDDVTIDIPKVGQLVEISEGGASGWPGVITGFEPVAGQALVLIEQFSPVPYMRTPEALLPEAVKASYALPVSWVFGLGLAKAIKKFGASLPPGKWSDDGNDYMLESPVPISEVEEFCRRSVPKPRQNPLCVQQAMMLRTLPLIMTEITLRPFPEGTPPDAVVVSVQELDDPEAEHIVFPED